MCGSNNGELQSSTACLPKMSVGLMDALKGNFSYLYFELQQPLDGIFSYRDLQWVNKETNGHGFRKVCAFVVIPWFKVLDFFMANANDPMKKHILCRIDVH